MSRSRLALWLAPPAVYGEFGPVSPVVGGPSLVDYPPWPSPDHRRHDLRTEFAACVRRIAGDREGVGVALSGGLDSLAVLVTLHRLVGRERKIVALVTELVDDTGRSNVPVVLRLVAGLGLTCELKVFDRDRLPRGPVAWSARGPRLEAVPTANQVIAEEAEAAGASVVLTGYGADEVLGSVRFLAAELALRGMLGRARGYARDSVFASRKALSFEAMAAGARMLPRKLRAETYFAAGCAALCGARPSTALSGPYRDLVSDWTRSWVDNVLRLHAEHHRSWATMEAWERLFPIHPMHSPGPVPVVDTFLDREFLEAACRLPLERRHDAGYPHAYWREKAQVLRLLPTAALPLLPRRKQVFHTELTSLSAERLDAPCLEEAGILRRAALAREDDILVRDRIRAVESWLGEALSRDCVLVD
ncbi:asparagine synthase-related protein [Actinosynnema sp. CS-041913]|uniref:asparagine synthase-related protein n=1 Tax=Actinosynnema sp. CS-041913 TaxID=3239917 RepID=UPI003D8C00CD